MKLKEKLAPKARWVLYLSLLLNLLVGGVAVGAMLQPERKPRPAVELMGAGPFTHALSEEQRRAFVGQMRAREDIRPPRRQELRQMNERLVEALRSEPLDVDRVLAVFEEQRRSSTALQQSVDRALIEFLQSLTAQERSVIADRLSASRERHRP